MGGSGSGGGGGGSGSDAETTQVGDAEVILNFSRFSETGDSPNDHDRFSAFFFTEPVWSGVAVGFEAGTCRVAQGIQHNFSGAAPVDTGSATLELVRTAPTEARVEIPLGQNAIAEYAKVWENQTQSDSPWIYGARFDGIDADAPSPVGLEDAIELPAAPPVLLRPTAGEAIALDTELASLTGTIDAIALARVTSRRIERGGRVLHATTHDSVSVPITMR